MGAAILHRGFLYGVADCQIPLVARAAGVLLFAASVCAYSESLPLRAILKWGWPGVGIVAGHQLRGLFAFTVSQSGFVAVIVSILIGGGFLRYRADSVRVPERG